MLTRLVVALLVAFVAGTGVGFAVARSAPEPDPKLEWCKRFIQQDRADACEILENLGTLGGP